MKLANEIKQKLKKAFPNNEFKIKIKRYRLNKSISIYTDALPILNEDDKHNFWLFRSRQISIIPSDVLESLKKFEKYGEIFDNIWEIVKEYENIRICQNSNENLKDGNTFVFIYPLVNS